MPDGCDLTSFYKGTFFSYDAFFRAFPNETFILDRSILSEMVYSKFFGRTRAFDNTYLTEFIESHDIKLFYLWNDHLDYMKRGPKDRIIYDAKDYSRLKNLFGQSIIELEWLDNFYKRVFLLYRETGMRLRETTMSVLEGSWIDIPNTSKSKVGRNIELDKPLQSIFNELKDWSENGYGSTLLDRGADHISKKFKKALRSIGADESKHFHSLRHTFAVRRLIQGTSIYDLKLLMGHSSVTTTEVYSNMNLKRVAQDFPTIVTSFVNEAKIGKMDTEMMDTIALPMAYVS